MKNKIFLYIVFVMISFLGSSCEKGQEEVNTVKVKLTIKPWKLSKFESYTYINDVLDTVRTSYSFSKIEFFLSGEIKYESENLSNPMMGIWWLNDDETIIYTDLKVENSKMVRSIFNDVKIIELTEDLLTVEGNGLFVTAGGNSIVHIPRSYYTNTK